VLPWRSLALRAPLRKKVLSSIGRSVAPWLTAVHGHANILVSSVEYGAMILDIPLLCPRSGGILAAYSDQGTHRQRVVEETFPPANPSRI
jgi:hypothetical protein